MFLESDKNVAKESLLSFVSNNFSPQPRQLFEKNVRVRLTRFAGIQRNTVGLLSLQTGYLDSYFFFLNSVPEILG